MRLIVTLILPPLLLTGCARSGSLVTQPVAFGTKIVEVSGGKQWGPVGSTLPQPLVVLVNGADGNPVTGALVVFRSEGSLCTPLQVLTDSSGQATTVVRLGFTGGPQVIRAETPGAQGKEATGLVLREVALGYQQIAGSAINDKHCSRCHDPESSMERVSNHDNLSPAPHEFSDGATLNRISNEDLVNIIAHGGPALGKSPQMPPYGGTLKPAEIKSVVSYLRAIADPPYEPSGVRYAK